MSDNKDTRTGYIAFFLKLDLIGTFQCPILWVSTASTPTCLLRQSGVQVFIALESLMIQRVPTYQADSWGNSRLKNIVGNDPAKMTHLALAFA